MSFSTNDQSKPKLNAKGKPGNNNAPTLREKHPESSDPCTAAVQEALDNLKSVHNAASWEDLTRILWPETFTQWRLLRAREDDPKFILPIQTDFNAYPDDFDIKLLDALRAHMLKLQLRVSAEGKIRLVQLTKLETKTDGNIIRAYFKTEVPK